MPAARQRSAPTTLAVAKVLNQFLNTDRFSDASLNGLQVEGIRAVRRVAVAVDASAATFAAARTAQADLLIVHHGIFWGKVVPLTGIHAQRMRLLLSAGFGLYAAHLPLDAHPVCGNNALLARGLGLKNRKPFGEYHGQLIGWSGTLPVQVSRAALAAKLAKLLHTPPRVLPLGPERIRTVAVVSGGGGDMAHQCWEGARPIEAFITGEASHEVFHPCQEAGLNLFLGGHYATETLGVQAVARFLEKQFKLPCVFLDLPTGM